MTVVSVGGAMLCSIVASADRFTGYKGDDYPHQLPLHIPSVALTVEDSEKYGLSDFNAYADWRTTDLFSHGNGFVKLGPEGRCA
jgi:hypothetical protein